MGDHVVVSKDGHHFQVSTDPKSGAEVWHAMDSENLQRANQAANALPGQAGAARDAIRQHQAMLNAAMGYDDN